MIVAIIPAAGLSRRMGQPKLVLDLHGEPVLARVVDRLKQGGADSVIVVVPPTEQEGATRLAEIARDRGARVVTLESPTPDMRSTLIHGLNAIENPRQTLGVMVAPGDAVGMTADIVRLVVDRFREDPSRLVVPISGNRRGHPLIMPRELIFRLNDLPSDQGLNALVRSRSEETVEIAVEDPHLAEDLNTPEDYSRVAGRGTNPSSHAL